MDKKTFSKKIKRFFQTVLLSIGFQWVIAVLFSVWVWLVFLTSRRSYINYELFEKYKRKPVIFAFWHGRMMMLSPVIFLGGRHSYVVASQHNGGRMMAKVQRLFGLGAIYGSTSKGALNVLRAGVDVLKRGDYSLCISPDGPGGPAMRLQDGALYFSKMTGAPIIPVSFSSSHAKFLKRWDSFMIAMPFCKIRYVFGNPVFVGRNDDIEQVRQKLEKIMIDQVHDLDSEFSYPPVQAGWTARKYKQAMREQRAAQKRKK